MKLIILSLNQLEIIEGKLEDFQDEIKFFITDEGEKKFRFNVCDLFLKRIDTSFIEFKNIKNSETNYVKLFCEYADMVYPHLLFSSIEKAKKVQKALLNYRVKELTEKTETYKNNFFKSLDELESFQSKLKNFK